MILIEDDRRTRLARTRGTGAIVASILLLAAIAGSGCTRDGSSTAARDPAPDTAAVEAALEAAGTYFDSGELPKAKAILLRLVERTPDEVRARELLGQVLILEASDLERAGRRAAAADTRTTAWTHYREAVRLRPESAGLRQSAGVTALAAGADDDALAQFTAAEALDRTNPQYPLYAAQVLIRRTRFAEADAALERALALDPDEPVAWASRAIVALEQSRFDDALAFIAEAREIAPGDLRFRVQSARILRRSGAPDAALELLLALPDGSRADPAVTEEIADAHAARGDHDLAAETWAGRYRALGDEPGAWRAALRAASAYVDAGNIAAARTWLDAARVAGATPEDVGPVAERLGAG